MKPLFTLAFLALPAFAAFPNGYNYCKVVTTSHTMVSGTNDFANYPLTVILTDPDLRTVSNGGLVNNGSGYDIGFYPDCSGTGTALKWEMESYSPTTGAIVAHVLRPTLSHTVDDTVGMYYGGSFSSFQSTGSAVWNANYKGVWHLADPTNPIDSTGVNNGTNGSTTAVAGQIDGASNMAGTSYISVPDSTSLHFGTGAFTFSMWVNIGTFTRYNSLGGNNVYSGGWDGFHLELDNRYGPNAVAINLPGYNPDSPPITDTAITLNTWHYLVATRDGSGNILMYWDGQASPHGGSATGDVSSGHSLHLGRNYDGTYPRNFGGLEDEVRLLGTNLTADWILTEYRNQSAPGTYISAGPRITPGTPAARVRHSVRGGA